MENKPSKAQVRGGARRQKGTVWRNVPIPLELLKRMDDVASKTGRTTAYEIRLALEAWVKAQQPPT